MQYRPAAYRLFQRTALYQEGGNRAAAFVQTCLYDDTFGRCIDWGSQFQNFGFEQYRFEQCIDVQAFFSGNVDELYIAAPFVRHDFVGSQLLADTLRVGGFFIDFVDGNHYRYAGGFSVGNCLDGCGITPSSACNRQESRYRLLSHRARAWR